MDSLESAMDYFDRESHLLEDEDPPLRIYPGHHPAPALSQTMPQERVPSTSQGMLHLPHNADYPPTSAYPYNSSVYHGLPPQITPSQAVSYNGVPSQMLSYYSGNAVYPSIPSFTANNSALNSNGIATNLGGSNKTQNGKRKRTTGGPQSTRTNKRPRQVAQAVTSPASPPPQCGVGPSTEIRSRSSDKENRDPNIGMSFIF